MLGVSPRRLPRLGKTIFNKVTNMKHSIETNHIFAALVKAQAEMPTANKDGNNPHFKSKYATLQSVVETCKPVLKKHGLAITQTFEPSCDGISIITTLVHESGQYISGSLFLRPTKNDPQGYGSAITYGRRYAWAAILGMVADEDDDGNEASAPVEKPWLNKTDEAWKAATAWLADEAKAQRGAESLKVCIAKLKQSYRLNGVMEAALLAISKGGIKA